MVLLYTIASNISIDRIYDIASNNLYILYIASIEEFGYT